jgi:hypothetical protein
VTFVDVVCCYGMTIAVRWRCVELARAAIGAVAVDEFRSLEFPIYHSGSSQLKSSTSSLFRILLAPE